jgi:hypothetical protein
MSSILISHLASGIVCLASMALYKHYKEGEIAMIVVSSARWPLALDAALMATDSEQA